jgi:flagellar motor component MotA
MTEIDRHSGKGGAVVRWLFAAAFVFAIVVSGFFSDLMNEAGLFYLVFGSIAAALMGFTGREIATAFKQAAGRAGDTESFGRSAYFWEAAARNAWILGVLGSALNFTIALGRESGGMADVSNRMIESLIVTLYGLVLAVVCLVPAMKLAAKAEKGRLQEEGRKVIESARSARVAFGAVTPDHVIGYVLFAAVLVLTVLFLVKGQPQNSPMPMGKVLFHWPAVLIVFGGAIALALFTGAGSGARAWTLGFAVTGLIGLLTGLIQAMFGFVHTNIAEISAAIAFIISGSSLSLLGLVAIAAPLEDRERMEGRREVTRSLSRLFWVLLPLLTFIFLVLTFIMVVTPMTKPGA